MAVSRSPKPFMGVRIPLPLLWFKDRCHTLTAVFLFALRASVYAGLVPFLVLSDVVRCFIQSVLLDIKKWCNWCSNWCSTWCSNRPDETGLFFYVREPVQAVWKFIIFRKWENRKQYFLDNLGAVTLNPIGKAGAGDGGRWWELKHRSKFRRCITLFSFLKNENRHLMGILLPIPSDIGPKASARRETPNRKIKNNGWIYFAHVLKLQSRLRKAGKPYI